MPEDRKRKHHVTIDDIGSAQQNDEPLPKVVRVSRLAFREADAVKRAFSVTGTALTYKGNLLGDPNTYRSQNVIPPASIIQPLGYNLITADIICQYFTTPDTRADKTVKFMGVANLSPNMVTNATIGTIGMAVGGLFVIGADIYLSGSGSEAFSSAMLGAYYASRYFIPPSTAAVAKFSHLAVDRFRKVKRAKTQVKTQRDFEANYLRDDNPQLYVELKTKCSELYSALCKTVDVVCKHPEPEECRKKYIEKMMSKDILRYRELPKLIRDRVFRGPYHSQLLMGKVQAFRSGLATYTNEWLQRMRDTPGVADEFGVILAILFLEASDNITRVAVASVINEIVTQMYELDDVEKVVYRKIIQSSFVAILCSFSDEFMQFVQQCVFPTSEYNPPLKREQIRIQDLIWTEIETLSQIEPIHHEIRRRASFVKDLQDEQLLATGSANILGESPRGAPPLYGDDDDSTMDDSTMDDSTDELSMDTEEELGMTMQLSTEDMVKASEVAQHIMRKYPEMQSNPIAAYMHELANISDDDLGGWFIALRNVILTAPQKQRSATELVVYYLTDAISRFWSDLSTGTKNINDFKELLDKQFRVKPHLIAFLSTRPEYGLNKWGEFLKRHTDGALRERARYLNTSSSDMRALAEGADLLREWIQNMSI